MKTSVWKKFRLRFIIFIKEITTGGKETRTALIRTVKVRKEEKKMHNEEKNDLIFSYFHTLLRKVNLSH